MHTAALPPLQQGPQVWRGPEMAARGDWIEPLSAAEIAEIEAAAAPLAARGADIAALTAADVPLPTLAARLGRIRHEVLEGRGFVLLRGLPVDRWPLRLSATAFFGLGLHLGHAVSQNAQGHVLGHVRDLGLKSDDPTVRIYQTAERQTFHTDSCDIVGLLCLQTAKEGGDSALVSTGAVWNAVLQQRPDLAAELLQPLATDRRGEVPPGQQPFFMIPVLNWFEGRLSGIYHRSYVDSAQRFADAPRLRPAQVEALDLFDRLCNSPDFHFRRRADQPRVRAAVRGDGPLAPRARGVQLLRARHRQHGGARPLRHARAAGALAGAAAGRRDPVVVRDDGAGGGVERRDQHRELDPSATATST
jgi:hypothetical protein